MRLLEEINAKQVQAMKDKDATAKGILSIVKNKIMLATIEKRKDNLELTDADIVSIIQKTIKEVDEEYESFAKVGRTEQANELKKQKDVLAVFLPKMMSEEEILNVLNSLEDKSMGNIMKHFKTNYAGKCDMSVVSKLAKTLN